MTQTTRTEHDSMGPVEVPAKALWGAQTQRSLQNFAISEDRIPVDLIHALAQIKQAAAVVNARLGVLDASGSSDVDRRWEGVVGRLRAVDVIVGVDRLMAA